LFVAALPSLNDSARGGAECSSLHGTRLVDLTLSPRKEITVVSGSVQICMKKEWASVCHERWGAAEAKVACGQLGLVYEGMLMYKLIEYSQG